MSTSNRRAFVLGSTASLLCVGAGPTPPPGELSATITTLKPRRRRVPRSHHEDVVLYLEGVPGRLPDTANDVHEIRQIDQEFVPRVSAVLVGTTLSFPNDDRIFHNVWSASKAAKFDLGLYKSGTTATYVAKRTGVVEVFCNIHPHMEAKILVLDTPYYGMSSSAGELRIRRIPPGKYKYVVWQAWGESKTGEVTVTSGATTRLELDVVTERSTRHQRKDGSDYPRRY